jgi:hypothetical protein
METFIQFAAIGIVSIVALFSALALQALLLRGVFALIEPATAPRRVTPLSIEHSRRMTVRGFAKAR